MVSLIKKEKKSFKFAIEGLVYAFKSQLNFKVQIGFGFLVVFLAMILGFNRNEWIVLLLLIGLVLSAELANSAIEVIVDLVTSEVHPKAKIAKDLSAGVVLLITIFVSIIGLLLFYPHFLKLFH